MSCRHNSGTESLTFQISPVRSLLSSFRCSFCRKGNWKSKRLSDWPRVTQVLSGRAGSSAQVCLAPKVTFFPLNHGAVFLPKAIVKIPCQKVLTTNVSDSGMKRKSLSGPMTRGSGCPWDMGLQGWIWLSERRGDFWLGCFSQEVLVELLIQEGW